MHPRFARLLLTGLLGLTFVPGSKLGAHEIPKRVTTVVFVRAQGKVMQVLVRAPLEAMRDVEFVTRGAGYLDLSAPQQYLRDAAQLWLADQIRLTESGVSLPAPTIRVVRVSQPSEQPFGSFAEALALVTGPPLAGETQLPWQQALLDVLLEVPVTSADARFAIDVQFARLGVDVRTVLHAVGAGGAERMLTWTGDVGMVALDPGWWQAAWQFIRMGFDHILDGLDHLLFLLCLVVPIRRLRPLVLMVTAFTVAHSITLVAAALGVVPKALWFPPLVETLIAASVVFMAIENMIRVRQDRRWLFAFGFGLIHGFGFSFALQESLQFAGRHLLTSLLSFNVGVELGQLLVVAVMVPVLGWVFRRVVAERVGVLIVSVLVGHTAWHWMTARGATLGEYDWSVPSMDAEFWLLLVRLGMVFVVVLAAGWGLSLANARWENSAGGG